MLPLGYIELEYLQSTGTQWIDTGVVPSATSMGWEQSIEWDNAPSSGQEITFGIKGSNGYLRAVLYSAPENSLTSSIGSTNNPNYSNSFISGRLKESVQFSNGTYTASLNNIIREGVYISSLIPTTSSMYMFGARYSNDQPTRVFTGKYYYLKLWKDSTLVRSFIPAKRASDGVLGMYDLVSNQFFTNQGSGTFIGGPIKAIVTSKQSVIKSGTDKVTSIKDIVVKPILPSGYKRLEYIESDGEQWIDTGINSQSSETLVTKWEGLSGYSQNSSGRRFVAAYENPNVSHYAEFDGGGKWGAYSSVTTGITTYGVLYDCVLQINGSTSTEHSIIINGITYSVSTTSFQSSSMGRFILFRLGELYKGSGQRIGDNKLWVNSSLVRNFIPSQRLSDNAIGMYDLVSNTFFTNRGTGSFTAGPEVSNYESIQSTKTIIRL